MFPTFIKKIHCNFADSFFFFEKSKMAAKMALDCCSDK